MPGVMADSSLIVGQAPGPGPGMSDTKDYLRPGAFNTAAQGRKMASAPIPVRCRHGKDAAIAVDLGRSWRAPRMKSG
jgi:hypothetical protein